MHAEHENIRALHVAVTGRRQAIKSEQIVAVARSADQLPAHLNGQLAELLADATATYEVLGDVRSADHAFDASKMDASTS
jgi:hypothetical protein